MADLTTHRQTLSTSATLDLVKELTIGQRLAESHESLSAFLRKSIFPRLGSFYAEVYLPVNPSGDFLPMQGSVKMKNVPAKIPADHEFIRHPGNSACPALYDKAKTSCQFISATGNGTHVLVPIPDCKDLSGLIYVGSPTRCSFSADFFDLLQTIAAVIGSRLKSMAMIHQLKETVRAKEYFNRLRTTLYEISEQTHYSQNIEELSTKMHETVRALVHAKNFYIALVEERRDEKHITFPYYADAHNSHFQGTTEKLETKPHSITGYLLQSGQPLVLTPENFDHICHTQNIKWEGTVPHSWLGAPFQLDHIVGAVVIQSYNDVIYTAKDKELMAFVARHIGEAVNRMLSIEKLKKAKERAELTEQNKSIFLANMSHEIRTPMNGILGLTDVVLSGELLPQQRTYLEMVHSSADRLLKLINDILDFSKIEAGKLELAISPFSLREAIKGAVEILAISATDKNIELNINYEENIPDFLLGDPNKLSQVLINLVGNGIKFTNRGSVTLSICPKDTTGNQDDHIELHFKIRDTGVGIPKKNLDKVFEAFSQLGTTRTSNHRGTGLGLVIAAELVEMMGGKICAESKPGMGTTFHFTIGFPLAPFTIDLNSSRKQAEQPQEITRGKVLALNILLVEDEFINRTLAVSVLEQEGWEVTVAENGLQALELIEITDFDLVLMDIQMPKLDGYKTAKTIRQQERQSGRHLPIIAMTAYAVQGDREKCLEAGMDGYIAKPIRPDILRFEIENVLHRTPPQLPNNRAAA